MTMGKLSPTAAPIPVNTMPPTMELMFLAVPAMMQPRHMEILADMTNHRRPKMSERRPMISIHTATATIYASEIQRRLSEGPRAALIAGKAFAEKVNGRGAQFSDRTSPYKVCEQMVKLEA
jgi:hypothetical protein